jgi:YesN/AraC family two-component response regulator
MKLGAEDFLPKPIDVEELEVVLQKTLEKKHLLEEARQLRARLDLATGAEESTRAYVERLESMVDEERLPAGDELISEIERFLRDQGAPGGQGNLPN